MTRRSSAILTVVFVLAVASTPAFASGFEVQEHSARGMGMANAGRSAVAEDAVTAFHNPAGLMKLKGFSGVLGLHLVTAGAEFDDYGSTRSAAFGPGVPAIGDDDIDTAMTFIPNLYLGMPLDDWIAVGLAVNVPFGLSTEYDDGWVGRYHALESALHTLNINPNVAVKVTDGFFFGIGVSYQTADALLTKAIDFGTAGAIPLGLTPEGVDGEVEIEGDGDSWGWNFGVLWDVTPDTRIGFSFRSSVLHDLEGDGDFTVPAAAVGLTAGGRFTDSDVTARVRLPEQLSLSVYHQLDEQWALVGDVTWTRWERFEELRIKFDNPAEPDSVVPEHWHNTYRWSVGAIYKHDDEWTFRGGLAWDETPIQTHYRTARIPTNSRFWIALGIGYKFHENISADFSYFHVFMQEGKVNEGTTTGQILRGGFDVAPNVFSLQITVEF